MKRLFIILFACLPLIMLAQEKKVEVKPYGFLKGDMVYVTNGVYSWGNANNNYLSSPQFAGEDKNSALGFTAQHSRFGLKIKKEGNIKVGGKLELDFYGGAFNANGKPRIRQAYAYISKGDFELRFGQQWDIFSPINATTNNTNGNMWYAGNRGFRRAQIQFLYKIPMNSKLQLSFGETSKEHNGLGVDNQSSFPMIQGRISKKIMDKYTIGAYFAYAKFSPDPDNSDLNYDMSGFGADFNLFFNKLISLKGEINYGKNLNNANLFNIAGNGSKNDDRKSLGFWFNATSKISEHFNTVVGYGLDNNKTKTLEQGDVKQNSVIYCDLIFPISNGFSIAAEIQNISTNIKDKNNNSAMVFNLSGKLSF